jgi:CO/xanthine dehydrogenase Mo-binding subunit
VRGVPNDGSGGGAGPPPPPSGWEGVGGCGGSRMTTPGFRVVGARAPRFDARDKVHGLLRYADDLALGGMLHARVVRASRPSARLLRVDTARAAAVPGVRCVLTAREVPNNVLFSDVPGQTTAVGPLRARTQVLADDVVRYLGEAIALVAAETEEAAEEAARLVTVAYEDLPGVFDPEEAMRPGAPQLEPTGNIVSRWKIRKGDVEAGFREADVVVAETYRTGFIDHAFIEPEAGVGWLDENGVITLRVATQVIEHFRDVANVLGLPHSRVRIIAPYIGGGFGGKEDVTVEVFLGLLVWKTRRPVRLCYSREESILSPTKRHPFVMRYRHGARRDGTLAALEVELISDAGGYAYLSPLTLLYAMVHAAGPYRIPHVKVDGVSVLTNNPPTSAFRGFGSAQPAFAYESQMDALARALDRDPLAFREQNYLRKGERLASGQELETAVLLPEAARQAWAALGPRAEPAGPGRRIGRGLAASMTAYGRIVWLHDWSSAWIELQMDGTVLLRTGVPDIGGGQAASLVQIAAEVLGVPSEAIAIHVGDSALTPLAGTTTATRQLYMSGSAVHKAASELRETLVQQAAQVLNVPPETIELRDGTAGTGGDGGKQLSFRELAAACARAHRPRSAFAVYQAPAGQVMDFETGQGKVFPDFTFGAQAVEVEVDEVTGEVRVLRVAACYDVGRAINRNSVEGQIEGGVAMGLGYALLEEDRVAAGVTLTPNLMTYLIPTALDVPDVSAIVLESGEGMGPWGARGIGEPAIVPTAPAVANAIADAVGVRPTRLPVTPERLWGALQARAAARVR